MTDQTALQYAAGVSFMRICASSAGPASAIPKATTPPESSIHPTTAGFLVGAPHIRLRDLPWREEPIWRGEAKVKHRPDVVARGDEHRASLVVGHGSWIFAVNDRLDPQA
ncbi:hypothetical protein GALL_329840 [mine drainage metagenome]|uniref:Uncharacterized protein n=1 Tax=mine drainage metagenome TaxID=410659 RepID=A0A1J5QP80_9ZZZZ